MFRRLLALAYCLLGLRNIRHRRYPASIAHLNKAIRYFPNYTAALCNRAMAHQAVGDHASAILDCDRAIELAPNLAMAFYNRGISEKSLEDFDRAVADHARAVTLDPNLADAHSELGVAYACKHEHDLAIASLTRAIRLEPAKASYYKERGFSRFHRGDFDQAAVDLRQSLGSEGDPYAMLMCYLARARRGVEASGELEGDARALGIEKWPYLVFDLFLGARTPDAVVAAAPNSASQAEAYFYIGQWHLLRNNQADAREALTQAARKCPANFVEYSGAIAELRRLGT